MLSTKKKTMKKIYKYELKPDAVTKISLPVGSQVLTVQVQNGNPCIWVLLDPEKDHTDYYFELFGTGHDIPELKLGGERIYIGTYQLDWFVGHLFLNTEW